MYILFHHGNFSHSTLPFQNGHPWFSICLNCTRLPRTSINATMNRRPALILSGGIYFSCFWTSQGLYGSLITIITFYFSLYSFPLPAITFFRHTQYLSMTDLCIFHNAVHSRCSIYYWLKQGYNSIKVTMTATVIIAHT